MHCSKSAKSAKEPRRAVQTAAHLVWQLQGDLPRTLETTGSQTERPTKVSWTAAAEGISGIISTHTLPRATSSGWFPPELERPAPTTRGTARGSVVPENLGAQAESASPVVKVRLSSKTCGQIRRPEGRRSGAPALLARSLRFLFPVFDYTVGPSAVRQAP